MAQIFGIDFGTTNSLASYIAGGEPTDFVKEERPHPSVVLYRGEEVLVGREARNQLERTEPGAVGDAVPSPKRYLGSGTGIHVGGVVKTPREVCAHVLRHVVEHAQVQQPDLDLSEAVITIPVRLDGLGRSELRQAAHDAGLRVWQFVHEPLAALYAWLRTRGRDTHELYDRRFFLVFDWGGGTLDLTLCQLVDGVLVQVLSRGDDRVGGDVFDERLRRLVSRRHAEQHGLGSSEMPVQPGARAKLLTRCEAAKIDLSKRDNALVFVPGYLSLEGEAADLELYVTRDELIEVNSDLLNAGMHTIDLLLDRAEMKDADIELVLALGGMANMPAVRDRLLKRFSPMRVPRVEHADRLIAQGAAWIANDEQRLHLSKPFELLLADDSPVPLINTSEKLPVRDQQQRYPYSFHCVDPRDGFARFQVMRPVRPGQPQTTDPRLPYATLFLPVDPAADPLYERLTLEIVIDEDLVVSASAYSEQTGETDNVKIHDLDFGLSVTGG